MTINTIYPPIRAAAPRLNSGQVVALAAPVAIRAAEAGDDGQPKGPPKFEMDAYNGGPMRLAGWKYPVVVDLTGISNLDKPRPALRDHDMGQVVGHTTSQTVEGGTLKASGVISGHGPHVDELRNTAANGFPWQASIGARVLEAEFCPAGETVQANGRTFAGPLNVARRTSLGEISFVPLGADDTTSATIAARAAEGSSMKFRAWAKACGFTAAQMQDENFVKQARAMFKAAYPDGDENDDSEDQGTAQAEGDGEADPASTTAKAGATRQNITASAGGGTTATGSGFDVGGAVADALKSIRAAAAAEQKKIAALQAKGSEYRDRVDPAKLADIQAKAIEGGWDEDKLELHLLRAARPDTTGPSANLQASFGINTGKGETVTGEIVAAACALAGGVPEKRALEGLSDQHKQIVVSRRVRNQVGSIYGMCAAIAAAHGMRLPSSRMDEDVIRAMLSVERRMEIQADGAGAGGFATMSLSGITENILNKAMLQAYGLVPSLVDQLTFQTDTNDFKQFKRYRLTQSGLMAALGATGELKTVTLQDESYSNQIKTQGMILPISREMLLNDDLGALIEAPTMLGRGAALYREMMVFSAYLGLKSITAPGASVGKTANGYNFYSTGAGNYLTGAASALAITSLSSAVQKFREQTDANSMPTLLDPDRLLVPPALEVTAQNLFNGSNLISTQLSTTAGAVTPDLNAHKGKYKPLVSPFLSATVAAKLAKNKNDPAFANFANASDASWSLLCDPAGGFATVQVGYLRGQRTPTIEKGESNFNQLGIAFRTYWDFGVAAHDSRCGVWSDGQ